MRVIHSPDQFTKCPGCERIYRVKPKSFHLLDQLMACRCLQHFKAIRYHRKENEMNKGCDFSRLVSKRDIEESLIRINECAGGLSYKEAEKILLHESVVRAVHTRMMISHPDKAHDAGYQFLTDLLECLPGIESLGKTHDEGPAQEESRIIPKILYTALLNYLDSKPASQECIKLARMLRENCF